MKILPTDFDGQSIRRVFDEATETWWFSVVDVVQVLTQSKSAQRYWSDLKRKLAQEAGSEQPYEEIVQLKLTATEGKQRETDCAKVGYLEQKCRKINRHRRIEFEELRRYQAAQQQQSEQALQDRTPLSEELGLEF